MDPLTATISADPLGVLVAFGAGILSFVSPCVLPLVPGYVSMVSGLSAADLDWEQHVVIDEKYLRPAEVDLLVGDPAKARRVLGWEREVDFPGLVTMMVDADMQLVRNQLR